MIPPPECGMGLQLTHESHNCALAPAACGHRADVHGSGNALPAAFARGLAFCPAGQEERPGRAGRTRPDPGSPPQLAGRPEAGPHRIIRGGAWMASIGV